jgi:hypothetical protein
LWFFRPPPAGITTQVSQRWICGGARNIERQMVF